MFDPRAPFTRAQARTAGLTDRQLSGPSYRRLLQGVYVSSKVADHPLTRARAALLVHPPTAVGTHFTAARVYGVPVPHDPLEHVTVPTAADRRQRLGMRCYVAAVAAEEVRLVSGLRVSAPGRLFVELAEGLSLVDLVIVGDWLVRQRLISLQELRAHAQSTAGERAAAYVRERVDSPMETRLRMLLVLAGLPEPEVNLRIHDDFGNVLLRLDLSYPSVKLAVEYDGRQHAERQDQWERDLDRREELDHGEWRLLVVTSRGIYKEPGRTVERVWKGLKARGYPKLRPPTDGWRPHFPMRT